MKTSFEHNPQWPALLRVGTGAVLFACFASLWPEYSRMYGGDGLADGQLFELLNPAPVLLDTVPSGTWWPVFIYLLLCLLLIVGVATRCVSGILLLLHHHLFTGLYEPFSYGADYIASSCLLYSMLFPAGGRHALVFLRVLQVHVCIIYFFAGLGKVLGSTWHNGEALWKAVTQPGFESVVKPDLLFLGEYPWLWLIGGWLVIVLELAYPVLIWLRSTRSYMLWATVAMHLGIVLFMGLYTFSALMMVLNLSAFYMPYRSFAKHSTSYNVSPLCLPTSGSKPDAGG